MNTTIDIKLKDNTVLHVAPIRRVAHALQETLHFELEKLVDEGILQKLKIDEKSEWLYCFACVHKPNGSIRLCVDSTHLNKYILRSHHNSKTLDGILPKLSEVKKFSIVDSIKLFFNLGLTERVSLLTTFGMMYGRYCYLRVPMGASLSSDIYQYKVDKIFKDIPQCEGIADGIAIFSFNDHDHDTTLYSVLDRAHDVGMRFNPEKCIFKQDSISFYGVTLSSDGVKPDPRKIKAIKNLPEPKSEALLQSFLGIVNYLSRFSPDIAKMTCNLRALLKKGTEFLWVPQHSTDFKAIVDELCSPKLLKYYDSTKKHYLEVDASQKAIGMALLQAVQEDSESEADGCQQNWVETNVNDCEKIIIPSDLLPVAYGSKTLTDTESQYANIECELLNVVARVEKFHTFCYGSSTIVLSDHKPLASIVRKDLINAPPRLQRLLLRLQKYNVSIWYKPGKSMMFADHLSKNVNPEVSKVPTVSGLNFEISSLELNTSPSKLERIRQESECDPQMLMLKETIIQGWPKDIKQCPLPLHSFWNFWDELSIIDGIVVKGNCIIIPTKF